MSSTAFAPLPFDVPGLVLLSLMLAACGAESGPLDPVEQAELAAAERRWAARSFRDYSFELRRLCSCSADWRAWSVVQVHGDTVTDVRLIETGSSLPFDRLVEWPTVDSLFTGIRELARHEHIVALSVSFDSQLGFPTVIDFDGDLPDVSGRYEARSVLPLTSLSAPSNQRMKLTVGPAGTMSARTAVRCNRNSSLSGSALRWPPFQSTSVAVVGGPTAAYARVR